METRVHGSGCLAEIVRDLAGEGDAVRLVRRAHEILLRELKPAWSAAVGDGAAPVGELHILANVPADAAVFEPTSQDSEHAVDVTQRDETFFVHMRRSDGTRLRLVYGQQTGLDAREARVLLEAAGAFVRARLDDLFEVEAVRHERMRLDERVAKLSLLFKGIDVALSSVELPKVMGAFMTCVTAGEAIGFNRAFLFLLDEQLHELHGAMAIGPASGDEAQRIWTRLDAESAGLDETLRRGLDEPTREPPASGSLAERVRAMHLPLDASYSVLARTVLNADSTPVRFHRGEEPEPFAEAFDSDDFVVVPIPGRDRTLGVLVVDNLYSGAPVDDDRVDLVAGLASYVGVIIENVLVFDDVSRRYAELSEVQAINRTLLSSNDFVEVLGRIAQISASMVHADGSLLFVANSTPAELRLETQYHASAALPEASVHICSEIAGETLKTARGSGQRIETRGEPLLDLVSAPMRIDGEVAGVLVVYRRVGEGTPSTFDAHSRRFLSIIADQAAIAVLLGRRLQIIRDDQERIQSLNALLYRNEKLAALGEAASMIAHEIRNPLTALGGFARRILRSSNLKTSDREAVQVIVDESARLERILNDQLAFVRSARLERKSTSLNEIVRESRRLLRQQLRDTNAHLELDLAAEVPQIALDADRMKQVLVNLIMNALDATARSGRIRISTRVHEESVELDVANTGPPIPPEQRAALFEPFTTTRQEGTGLGLAVVHQIVTEHDGEIEVLSEHEWGTIFRIRLAVPVADVDSPGEIAPHGS